MQRGSGLRQWGRSSRWLWQQQQCSHVQWNQFILWLWCLGLGGELRAYRIDLLHCRRRSFRLSDVYFLARPRVRMQCSGCRSGHLDQRSSTIYCHYIPSSNFHPNYPRHHYHDWQAMYNGQGCFHYHHFNCSCHHAKILRNGLLQGPMVPTARLLLARLPQLSLGHEMPAIPVLAVPSRARMSSCIVDIRNICIAMLILSVVRILYFWNIR